ncbi:hypothetical protein AAFN60_06385 [Roseibacillus persicicus]|uniref:hypothetical protein n=1 Tax=Roseibacillus persicicus TaxID=454148 RepID=UPI00398B1171
MKVTSPSYLVIFLISSISQSASSALLSHESFTGYSLGDLPETGPHPSTVGYSGDWFDGGFADAEPAVSSGSLVYNDSLYLGSSGDKVSKGPDLAGINAGNSGRAGRALDPSLVVTNSTTGTLYLSFLFQTGLENAASNANTYQTVALWNGDIGNDGLRNFDLGVAAGDFGTSNYGFRVNNSTVGDMGVASDASVHLFVVRFDFSASAASDQVTTWIDPTLGAGDPTGGVTLSGADLAWDTLAFSDYASNSSSWDEVRFGTTFDSVTIPEPSVVLFSTVGLFGLFGLIRRRR